MGVGQHGLILGHALFLAEEEPSHKQEVAAILPKLELVLIVLGLKHPKLLIVIPMFVLVKLQ